MNWLLGLWLDLIGWGLVALARGVHAAICWIHGGRLL